MIFVLLKEDKGGSSFSVTKNSAENTELNKKRNKKTINVFLK